MREEEIVTLEKERERKGERSEGVRRREKGKRE